MVAAFNGDGVANLAHLSYEDPVDLRCGRPPCEHLLDGWSGPPHPLRLAAVAGTGIASVGHFVLNASVVFGTPVLLRAMPSSAWTCSILGVDASLLDGRADSVHLGVGYPVRCFTDGFQKGIP